MDGSIPRFACDAMLGGLARWLRAAGYDTSWTYGIDDGDLVRAAFEERRILLTSDAPMLERAALRDGHVTHLFMPRNLSPTDGLALVLGHFRLPLLEPRCMSCGGALHLVGKDSIKEEVPSAAYENYAEFFRCAGCKKVLWRGTHWTRITTALKTALNHRPLGGKPC